MSVAGRPRDGTQRARISGWKNSDIACWTVVTVLPTVSAEPCSAPDSRPSQNLAACGCCCRISAGCSAATGLATHSSTCSSVRPVNAAACRNPCNTLAVSAA